MAAILASFSSVLSITKEVAKTHINLQNEQKKLATFLKDPFKK